MCKKVKCYLELPFIGLIGGGRNGHGQLVEWEGE